jgi:hypothetical protein
MRIENTSFRISKISGALALLVWLTASNLLAGEPGVFQFQHETAGGTKFSSEIGFSSDFKGSGAIYFEDGAVHGAFDEWLSAHVRGDLGESVSYSFELGVGLLTAPRSFLGIYQIKADSPETVDVYSSPAAYFPYAYNGRWDGFVFPLDSLNSGGPVGWPDKASFGFSALYEILGSAFDGTLHWSLGRKRREWGAMDQGASLVLNEAAQPFFGGELLFRPFSWLGFSSLTGVLEYFDSNGVQISPKTFHNAYSVSMLELGWKYANIDFGATTVWPKRFEPGYLFPLTFSLLYQNNIGDFDNIGLFGSIKLRKPGLGFLWASFFIDEINFEKDFFILDREMYAWQGGLKLILPKLPFASLALSYTKIEPYCYTHQKTQVPWYSVPMEEAYNSHGSGLGYYLPPNSDEIKLRFQTMMPDNMRINAQFQMIRHGADYGGSAVDGSSYLSELTANGRSDNSILRKFFLRDGAYQWSYIIKGGAIHAFTKLPVELSLEAGFIVSYWTDIDGAANSGSARAYHPINTDDYPSRTGFIANVGIRVFK